MSVSRFEGIASPVARPRSRSREPHGIWTGLLARWQSIQLDRELAAGVSPSARAVLTARAAQITRPRSRRRIADGLVAALGRAGDRSLRLSAAIPPHAREVLAARPVLAALDRRLRAPEPVTARGMAILRTLLIDGRSALYQPDGRGALGSRLRAAAAALEPERWD